MGFQGFPTLEFTTGIKSEFVFGYWCLYLGLGLGSGLGSGGLVNLVWQCQSENWCYESRIESQNWWKDEDSAAVAGVECDEAFHSIRKPEFYY